MKRRGVDLLRPFENMAAGDAARLRPNGDAEGDAASLRPYGRTDPAGFGVDQHVRLVRLERLEARLEDVESVVSDIQTPLEIGVAQAAARSRGGLGALQGVKAAGGADGGGPLTGSGQLLHHAVDRISPARQLNLKIRAILGEVDLFSGESFQLAIGDGNRNCASAGFAAGLNSTSSTWLPLARA